MLRYSEPPNAPLVLERDYFDLLSMVALGKQLLLQLLFQEKVMIVDSPGIGESEVMSEFVLSYLPRAFCFLYVINSDNAGGVQEDRVSIFIE